MPNLTYLEIPVVTVAGLYSNWVPKGHWFSPRNLPSLTHLICPEAPESLMGKLFGDSFPPNLTYIQFPDNFNQSLDNILPSSLKVLKFGKKFNQSVDFLPNSLVKIKFGENFSRSIGNLPVGIKKLVFHDFQFNKPQNNNNLPPNLQNLQLYIPFNLIFSLVSNSFLIGWCPPSLTQLALHVSFPHVCPLIPISVRYLSICNLEKLDGKFPSNLVGLEIYNQLSEPLISLPPTLKYLITEEDVVPPLPPSLTHIIFSSDGVDFRGENWEPLPQNLPNLTHLYLISNDTDKLLYFFKLNLESLNFYGI